MERLVTVGFVASLSACTTLGSVPTQAIAIADLALSNGAPAGKALVTAGGDQINISLAAFGMPQGAHGMHLHMVGSCDAPTFSSAGAHLNPDHHQHGTANPDGSHLGDLPNLSINASGTGTISVQLKGTRADTEAAMFDADGTAIIVHSGADDYKTDPSGNSGARIACGVLKRN
ncbi:superoxide dismutase family protein [Novosphingobium sp.]|uniref:superoxide dismutase family protein n=1 Tax=Novosphingobium sp. TaxID=1874826 RepID=UPI0025FAE70F|nr:superoxide dismutase family protein [Novosphingobium sp.]